MPQVRLGSYSPGKTWNSFMVCLWIRCTQKLTRCGAANMCRSFSEFFLLPCSCYPCVDSSLTITKDPVKRVAHNPLASPNLEGASRFHAESRELEATRIKLPLLNISIEAAYRQCLTRSYSSCNQTKLSEKFEMHCFRSVVKCFGQVLMLEITNELKKSLL